MTWNSENVSSIEWTLSTPEFSRTVKETDKYGEDNVLHTLEPTATPKRHFKLHICPIYARQIRSIGSLKNHLRENL